MQVTFLRSDEVRLAKSFIKNPEGELVKTNYPNVANFSSFTENPTNIQDFFLFLENYAAAGACLLKGLINRPLKLESRAGATDANDLTGWICLDLDGANYPDPDAFMADLGAPEVSYIVQYSASQGITPGVGGLRCHIFVFLDAPQHPAILKLWLQTLNLTKPALRTGTALTKTACALSWPLDVTTCQNDKLLYIAPPELHGIQDPFPDNRIQLVSKEKPSLSFTQPGLSQSVLRPLIDTRINELRENAGIAKRKPSVFKASNGIEYLTKPDQAVITSKRVERGFVYLNLNGGDSFAYFHPEDNAEFLYNFKGEPVYRLEEIAPEYYHASKHSSTNGVNGKTYLAFRDFKTAQYYNGWYDQEASELILHQARNETQLRHFAKQHGFALGDFIPDWDRVFSPHDKLVLDSTARIVNVFRPSEIMRRAPSPVTQVPTVCCKVVNHMLGDDPVIVDHFHNWMACVLQFLDRTYTGWILHGTQGTGKGLFMNRILMPIMGPQNMTMKRMEELESDFTGFFENVFIVVIDEIQTSASLRQAKITSKLKNLMVEPYVSIRRMYHEPYLSQNYANMIFTSNMNDPVVVAPDDRRFNVANFQRRALEISDEEIAGIKEELNDMYSYWMNYAADKEKARRPLQTQSRTELIETNLAAADVVVRALRLGDLAFFVDQLPTDEPVKSHNVIPALDARTTLAAAYRALIGEIVHQTKTKLSRDNLMTIFRYCVGNVPDSPNKFTSYLKHHQIHMTYIWTGGKTVRGIDIEWHTEPTWLLQTQKELA